MLTIGIILTLPPSCGPTVSHGLHPGVFAEFFAAVLRYARVNYSLVPLVAGDGPCRFGCYNASAGAFAGEPPRAH